MEHQQMQSETNYPSEQNDLQNNTGISEMFAHDVEMKGMTSNADLLEPIRQFD